MVAVGAMLDYQLFPAQMFSLRCLGLLTPYKHIKNTWPKSKFTRWFRKEGTLSFGFAVLFLASCLVLTVIHGALELYQILLAVSVFPSVSKPSDADIENDLVGILSNLPFFGIHFRGFVVLLVVFLNRHKWLALQSKSWKFFLKVFPDDLTREKLYAKWKRYSLGLSILTCFLHVGWEVGDWTEYNSRYSSLSVMLNDTSVWEPLPVKIRTWQYIIVYFLFCFVPFVLAQQIFTVLLILAGVGADAVRTLNEEVKAALESCNSGATCAGNLSIISAEVKSWEERYLAVLEFVKLLNELFSWIFFVIYGSDFVAVLGFGARVVNNTSGSKFSKIIFLLCSAALYLTYETCFLVWLIRLYEESTRLPFSVYQLTVEVETGIESITDGKSNDTKGYKTVPWKKVLVQQLQSFEDSVYNFPCVISGAGLFDCTRGLIVRSLTLTLSLVVLAKELMDKSDHKTKSTGGSSHVCNATL